MGRSFFDASGHGRYSDYNEDDMEVTYKSLIDSEGVLTDGKHGMIGLIVFPSFYNAKCFLAQELFWWVDEDKRHTPLSIKLLKRGEALAKDKGAQTMIMLSVDHFGDTVDKIYDKNRLRCSNLTPHIGKVRDIFVYLSMI